MNPGNFIAMQPQRITTNRDPVRIELSAEQICARALGISLTKSIPMEGGLYTGIGQMLRFSRENVIGIGLREMARRLHVAPAHVVDLEKGNRRPSETLMIAMSDEYQFSIPLLRAGFKKPDPEVLVLACETPESSEYTVRLLRVTRGMSREEYDQVIELALSMQRKR